MEESDIAESWLRYTENPGTIPEEHPDFSAWMELSILAVDHPENAINVIVEILNLSPTEDQKVELAAGPFEDVLVNIISPWNNIKLDEILYLVKNLGKYVWMGRMPEENKRWLLAVLSD